MADEFEGEDLNVWLVNPLDDFETTWSFIAEAGTTLPVLFDTVGTYTSYPPTDDSFAPFPVHVVVGRDGGIRYLSRQYDAEELRAAIRAALDSE